MPRRSASPSQHERSAGTPSGLGVVPATADGYPPAPVPLGAALDEVAVALQGCHACPLHAGATQAVPGEGARTARLVLVGEQPGDQEDRAGRPFVGPAGGVLDRALAEAGIDRELVYVTNAVKHFGWEPRGKRRIHKTPSAEEVRACAPWLLAELDAIRPDAVVALGLTAARSLLGRPVKLGDLRGRWVDWPLEGRFTATAHPSSVLRVPPAHRDAQLQGLVDDLRFIASALA